MSNQVNIHFLGAAGTVTGSKYLVEHGEVKFLIDCGLFQGLKKLRLLNWQYLPVKAEEINFVLLTHGHLDHCGYLPRLVKAGFKGKIIGTKPTLDIAEIILTDSAKIQEEGAKKANEEGFSKHKPAKPLYDLIDVNKTLQLFESIESNKQFQISPNIKARFKYVGHIIGATFIELEINNKKFVFSGDIGRIKDPLMRPPEKPEEADILVIESTYGNRFHLDNSTENELAEIVLKTIEKGGNLIIPSFAVERTQLLMYILWQLSVKKAIPDVPMIMDSPMGTNVLRVFYEHSEWHKLTKEECESMCRMFHIVSSFGETQAIIHDTQPKIIIAGSGMISGGRVLSYLQKFISKPETTVLLVGYQTEGTRGRALLNGAREIKFYGQYHEVKADIKLLDGLSAHADQPELIDWVSQIKHAPKKVFIVHGEGQSADALRVKIQDTYGWDCAIPELFEIREII